MNSFNSFKSFQIIYSETSVLQVLKNNFSDYYAHLHLKKKPEKLVEHVEQVCKFALRLIDVHHLEPVVHRLISPIINQDEINKPEEVGSFIKELFFNCIVFHDVGKINENFQVERMKNLKVQSNRANEIGSRHSILSAFIYNTDHINKIYQSQDLNDKSKFLLYVVSFLLSLPILKHHSPYLDNNIDFPGELTIALQPYLKKIGIRYDLNDLNVFFKNYEAVLKQFTNGALAEACYFPIFMLIKLCYSLLTAADYCATSHFVMDLEIDDFGILNNKQKQLLFENFKTVKSYNKLFFEQRDYFEKVAFDALTECKTENLNVLRQKLMSEVLSVLETNSDQNVFYLEAPTGSGKTNISMAAALNILQQNDNINKIFYVFPFTTLITQTAKSISETLKLPADYMIQLHSRSGFTPKRDGDLEAAENLNYIDYLFVNYAITLLTHVKFFDILKTNSKEPNYIFHRLANSIVIIDELQSYPPREWDKIVFFINQMADLFNIKFILMSATLPKLDQLDVLHYQLKFYPLIKNKQNYFQNPNFRDRVRFNFNLIDEKLTLQDLSSIVLEHCEKYANSHDGKVKGIIEFIYKQTASNFLKEIETEAKAKGYQLFLLSGTILEPRRREVIRLIKNPAENMDKILLITTQVVEAGVDIDMDIGFKDRSLIDSDEQLAGRVNRNAKPEPSHVFIFDLDRAFRIYGSDLRYKMTRDQISLADYQKILSLKDFDLLYQKVCNKINEENSNEYMLNFTDYKKQFQRLDFKKIDWDFKIIDQQNVTIYVPMPIPAIHFSAHEKDFLRQLVCLKNDNVIDGEEVWYKYLEIIHSENLNFIKKKIEIKKIYGIMSQFMFSIHIHSKIINELIRFCDSSYYEKYQILYLQEWRDVYAFETGIKDDKFDESAFI